jgi:peptidoglycan/LPS O-acetylase OafA/YrhL
MMLLPIALCIAAAAQRDQANRPTVWSRTFLVLLGEASYAFYLLHYLVLRAWTREIGRFDGSTPRVLALFVCLLVVSIGSAWVAFRWLERPAERRLRGDRPRLMLIEAAPALAPAPREAPQADQD